MVDVIVGDGVHLQRDVHAYIPRVGLELSRYDWAKEEPASSDWNLWRHTIKAVTENGTLAFFNSLGKWVATPHQPSEWQYSPSARTL